MQRYFIAPSQFDADRVTIDGDDAHHLARVMRIQTGGRIVVCDGERREALAEVSEIGADRVVARIVEERPASAREPRWRVTIAQALPKGDKLETVIQKGTELGAYAFVPFEAARTVVRYDNRKEEKRRSRWTRIAKEAAEQAHRGRLPQVEEVQSWGALLRRIPSCDLALLCYEAQGGAPERGIGAALRRFGAQPRAAGQADILVIVGPEGGFTPEEAEQAEAAGAVSVGLGARILRTETAGMAALTCLMYESGEMGGA
ncbi:16S rRNA (uracil(1498)-N(3))-methyltransferase [Paenibacillus sp. IB182496]|uniref:Ribosomal RNA small subunit methyltransferase E n=1 Tax=Paenibacillus sabuli TaxID=2772509 RepID=A0A927BPR8_9BACL|nr:RsmE family RNA methyltransferase [Paenibacillus sabuli]MBD2844467.1 16S rRNA (uracil(1498)-N(3))-methyltransferase [Paenibacillus sabuli]